MPNKDISYCADGAKCPKRKTCYRFMTEHGPEDLVWYANFYEEAKQSGKSCVNYMEI